MQWNLADDQRIRANNKCFYAYSSTTSAAKLSFSTCGEAASSSSQWRFMQTDDHFNIRSQSMLNVVLAVDVEGKLTLDYYNQNDDKQKWRIKF